MSNANTRSTMKEHAHLDGPYLTIPVLSTCRVTSEVQSDPSVVGDVIRQQALKDGRPLQGVWSSYDQEYQPIGEPELDLNCPLSSLNSPLTSDKQERELGRRCVAMLSFFYTFISAFESCLVCLIFHGFLQRRNAFEKTSRESCSALR